nr:AlNc14C230G9289 [Albugo laibachii Nc14]|eukprot:CCA24269.1 AlNc14C230G9289 [Albugo laibachii Nc14]
MEMYPDDVCEDVHNTKLLKSIQRGAHEGQKKEQQSNMAVPRITSKFLKCVSLEVRADQDPGMNQALEKFMRSIVYKDGSTFVHVFDLGIESSANALVLVWAKDENLLARIENSNWKEKDLKECYAHYGSQFDAPPIGGEISVFTRRIHSTMFRPNYYSDCVIVYHEHPLECRDCIRMKSMKAIRFSRMTSLIKVEPHQMTELRECISEKNEKLCSWFYSTPNDMFKKHEFPTSRRKIPTFSEKVKSNVKAWINGRLSNQVKQNSNAARSSESYLSSPKTPRSYSEDTSSSRSNPNQAGRLVTVVKVEYGYPQCLACLALVHEVLYITSGLYNYVWMVAPEEGSMVCDCHDWYDKEDTSKESFQHSFHSLRPISSIEAIRHVFGWNPSYLHTNSFKYVLHIKNVLHEDFYGVMRTKDPVPVKAD